MSDQRWPCPICGVLDDAPHTPIDHPWLLRGHRMVPVSKVKEAVEKERERIRTAVEELPDDCHDHEGLHCEWDARGRCTSVARLAVLSILTPEPTR